MFKICSTRDSRKARCFEELIRFHYTINPDNEIEQISYVISTMVLVKLIFYPT